LDASRLAATFGLTLPHWRDSLKSCVARLLARQDARKPSLAR